MELGSGVHGVITTDASVGPCLSRSGFGYVVEVSGDECVGQLLVSPDDAISFVESGGSIIIVSVGGPYSMVSADFQQGIVSISCESGNFEFSGLSSDDVMFLFKLGMESGWSVEVKPK